MSDNLTPKQEIFCLEYIVDLTASKAAIRAGYPAKSARSMGSQLLANPKIQTRLETLFSERRERLEVSADNTIKELARMGFSDMRHFARWGQKAVLVSQGKGKRRKRMMVNYVDFIDSDKVDGAQVKEVKIDKHGQASIKLHDKSKPLDTLARHLGLTGPDSGDKALEGYAQAVIGGYEKGKTYKKPPA